MLPVPHKSDPAWFPCRKKAKRKAKEKVVASRLASCARVPRDASLNLERGLSGPAFIPSVQGLRPLKILPPSARGGRAQSPLVGAGTLAGALCVSGDTPAARRGSGLTLAGQPAGHLDDARRDILPAPTFIRPVCTAWTARLREAHTWTR